jgi:deoxyribodipyrimidine photo-lyase
MNISLMRESYIIKEKRLVIMISERRVKNLNSFEIKNRKYVLYWMQSSQRTEYNLALAYAILKANKLNKPIIAFFGITFTYPKANLRHYQFMIEGLKEVNNSLEEIGVKTIVLKKSPEKGIVDLSKDSCLIVADKGYLKTIKQWNKIVAAQVECPLIQVEDNVVVPVGEVSGKEEYSAATIRPKIMKKRQIYLTKLSKTKPVRNSLDLEFATLDLTDYKEITSDRNMDKSLKTARYFKGGSSEASKRLENFINNKLSDYPEHKNDPNADCLSNLSPYLHFGQISPIYVTRRILEAPVCKATKEAYLEELIVRRELSVNYVNFNKNYDSFDGLPEWAKRTLLSHKKDPREYLYSLEELENAKTHDPYWNAAQNEMRVTGKMHGYMRMYWGKKLIEWTDNPETAFKIALHLNDKYELDGRDPNGYAGVAWCFGKHDRPWKERPIFGIVRYMNSDGLRRKFDADKYVQKIKELEK